jgi:hypothetical protein
MKGDVLLMETERKDTFVDQRYSSTIFFVGLAVVYVGRAQLDLHSGEGETISLYVVEGLSCSIRIGKSLS